MFGPNQLHAPRFLIPALVAVVAFFAGSTLAAYGSNPVPQSCIGHGF